MRVPKHYLFALVAGGGTVPPELGAARRLLERGHRVTVLGEDTMREEVLATGADFRRWERGTNRPTRRAEDDPIRDWEVSSPLKMFRRVLDQQFIGPAPGYAADVDASIRVVSPDVVVATLFGFGAMAAAERARLPLVILHANIYPVPTVGRPAFGLGFSWPRGSFGRTRDRIVPALLQRMWDRQGRDRFNAFRADLGLPPLRHFLDQLGVAERQLVLTSLAFDGPGHLPASVVHTGPVLDDPSWADATWRAPAGQHPLVLVGLSSTFQDQGALLQRIADALGRLPVRGVITTGPAIDPADLSAPANVSVVASAPHAQVLHHAAVAVTHGGHGTLVKALAAEVPVLVLPHGRDQADNAARVVAAGAGLMLKRTAGTDRIARSVQRLLDDPVRRAAAATLGATLRTDAAADTLIRELEGVPHDRPEVVTT